MSNNNINSGNNNSINNSGNNSINVNSRNNSINVNSRNNSINVNSSNSDKMDGLYKSVNYANDDAKWDDCNIRQQIASYSFNVQPEGMISTGGRSQVSVGNTSFPGSDKLSNPLNLINNNKK